MDPTTGTERGHPHTVAVDRPDLLTEAAPTWVGLVALVTALVALGGTGSAQDAGSDVGAFLPGWLVKLVPVHGAPLGGR